MDQIESLLKEKRVFKANRDFTKNANWNRKQIAEYRKLGAKSPERFWAKMARNDVSWFTPWKKTLQWKPPFAKWFVGGKLNVSYNCLDRHLEGENAWRRNKAAIVWEGEPGDTRVLTFGELHREVCRFANVLKESGVRKGDRVALYMPMIPELAIALLACARIGAPHSVVFGGFSAEALRDRINDAGAKLVVTADGGFRRGEPHALKPAVDEALEGCPDIERVIVVKRTGQATAMKSGRDLWWHDAVQNASAKCAPARLDSEHPLFILYTSGTTGKPKGILHTTGGYLTHVTTTAKAIFDLKDSDTYWCTADIGWITGHSYVVYGILANGATTLMYEGTPTHPGPDRFWDIIERWGVTVFYTAPTAIRTFVRLGDEHPKGHDLSSLRLLGTVGEPINPEAWMWYHRVIGGRRCPIVDTWWQTETGGIMITPLPGATALKPGSATRPFFGIQPALVDADGKVLEGEAEGNLVILESWPGQMRSVYGDHQRFVDTYFKTYPGMYFAGDGCRRDKDGYYWITGRVDDVINVSGHRMGTAEVESALVEHTSVAEAAVVGYPHDIKGQGIYAYVTLNLGIDPSDDLRKELVQWVRKEIGPIATPDLLQWAPGLPKTRSGKIMRRILRKIAEDDFGNLGDTSTLAEPAVVEDLIENRMNR